MLSWLIPSSQSENSLTSIHALLAS
jgi:hypothetical protein